MHADRRRFTHRPRRMHTVPGIDRVMLLNARPAAVRPESATADPGRPRNHKASPRPPPIANPDIVAGTPAGTAYTVLDGVPHGDLFGGMSTNGVHLSHVIYIQYWIFIGKCPLKGVHSTVENQ